MEAIANTKECMKVCQSNCSCTAFSYSKVVCSIWQGELLNVKQQNGTTNTDGEIVYLRLAVQEIHSWENGVRRRVVIGFVVGASVSALILLVLVLLIIQRKKQNLYGHSTNIKDGGGVIAFRYVNLQRATKNFSEKLGGGGFGNVFKGILSDSTSIAVKTLNGAHQGEKQFRAEISTMGMIQHVNLLKLIVSVLKVIRRIIVYEYMQNRSLDVHLFRSSGTTLSWGTRYQISIGIAKGLSYLHESCHECIIHCDVKPENILLDTSFVPKIADFGMAKLSGRDFSRVLTTMRGTLGYLAPEWIRGVAITQKG
jgi:RIO-like serine/threonine protein kinase